MNETVTVEESVASVAPETAPPPAAEPVAPGRARPPFAHTPDYLLEVRLTLSAEVGRIQMPVRQVMALAPGTVVELQRNASEPIEILANGRCIARGEIVVIGEQFGVRITELGPAY